MFKKAQGFYADFLIGLLVLILITFIFTQTIIDLNSREDKFQELINDGTAISNALMSQGYCPTGNCLNDWSNLQGRVGFIKEGKIQLDKYDSFTQLLSTQEGYQTSRILLGTKNDYVLYFEFNNQIISEIFGKVNDKSLINTKESIRITRIIYYNLDDNGQITDQGRIVKMNILVFGKERSTVSDQVICKKADDVGFCDILGDLASDYKKDCCVSWDLCKNPDGSCT